MNKFKVALSIIAVIGAMLIAGAPAATADGNYCTGEGNVYNYGNWDCGTPNGYSPWSNIREHDADSFRRITFDKRQGTHAGRFEVGPGDVPPNSGSAERVEVYGLPGTSQTEGDAVYYAFSIKFGSTWQTTGPATIVSQWRANNWSSGSPPLAVFTPSDTSDRMRLQQRSADCTTLPCSWDVGHTLMTGDEFRATRGMWHDFIIYVDWSVTDGRLKAWHRVEGETDMTVLFDHQNVPTLNAVNGEAGVVYSKYGIYRMGPQPFTHTLYNDSYCVAKWYAAARTCLP